MNQSDLSTVAGLIAEVAKSVQTLGNHIAAMAKAEATQQVAPAQHATFLPPADEQPVTPPAQAAEQPAPPAVEPAQPAQPATQPATAPVQTPAAAQTVDPFLQLSDRLKQIRGLVQAQAPAFNQQIMVLIEKYAPGSTAAGRTGLQEVPEAQYPALIADVEQVARSLGAQV